MLNHSARIDYRVSSEQKYQTVAFIGRGIRKEQSIYPLSARSHLSLDAFSLSAPESKCEKEQKCEIRQRKRLSSFEPGSYQSDPRPLAGVVLFNSRPASPFLICSDTHHWILFFQKEKRENKSP